MSNWIKTLLNLFTTKEEPYPKYLCKKHKGLLVIYKYINYWKPNDYEKCYLGKKEDGLYSDIEVDEMGEFTFNEFKISKAELIDWCKEYTHMPFVHSYQLGDLEDLNKVIRIKDEDELEQFLGTLQRRN